MSEQGRKQEDISSHKSSRTATTLPPQLGAAAGSPSILAYPLPHNPHEYSPHHRLYTMMRPGALAMAPAMAQPIQTAKPCLSSDMGPPIFMPSLNLGTPKGSSSSSASSPISSATGPNSSISSSAGGGVVNAHSMSDMILSNTPSVPEFHHSIHPFYSAPGIRPGSGHVTIPTALPQVSAVVTNKRPLSVSSGNIAKPTPVQASHAPKTGGGTYIKTLPPHSASKMIGTPHSPVAGSTNKSLAVPSASSSGVISVSIPCSTQAASPSFPPGSSVIKQPLPSQPRPPHHHHHAHLHGSTVSVHSGTPSSQLYPPLTGKQQPRGNPEPMYIAHPTIQGHVIPVAAYPAILPGHGGAGAVVPSPGHPHPTSSTLTELLAPSPAVGSSSLRDGGVGGKVGMRPYSPGQQHISSSSRHSPSAIRERSASGGDAASSGVLSPQTRSESHSHTTTSGQPTSNADHMDTRLERPAQPSSGSSATQQLPSPQGVPSPYQGPQRERSNSTEMSSVIPIITNPGLTGRHIAAISSNQPPGYPPSNTQPQSLPSQPAPNPHRGPRSKSEYGGPGVDPAPIIPSPVHPTTLHIVAGANPQVPNASPVGADGKVPMPSAPSFGQLAATQSTLTATVISSTSSSVNSPGASPHPNSLPLSATGSPMTSLSPSRRPGIIRKRPHESGWTGSPNLNKTPFGSSVPHSLSGLTPRGDNGAHLSHPLSPTVSTHSPLPDPLTNHISSSQGDSAPSASEVLPSPRKKRRKQDVIATDDQYASNVPNNIRPDVAVTMDGDHSSSVSPHHQGSAVAMATRARGRTDDSSSRREESAAQAPPPEVGGEKTEVQYLSQLHQSQWPISGLYRTHHRAAHNHFKRHADIKHIEIDAVTATGIANDRTSVARASGWKIHHLDPQLEEMLQVERDILEMVKKVEKSLSNLSQCATCPVPSEVVEGLEEIVQGNVARSSRIISHLENTRNKMIKLLDHKPTVMDLLMKYSTNKRSSPINSLPHKLRT